MGLNAIFYEHWEDSKDKPTETFKEMCYGIAEVCYTRYCHCVSHLDKDVVLDSIVEGMLHYRLKFQPVEGNDPGRGIKYYFYTMGTGLLLKHRKK